MIPCNSLLLFVLLFLVAFPAVAQESEAIEDFVLFDGRNAMRTLEDSHGVHAMFICHENEAFRVAFSVTMPEGRGRDVSLYSPVYRETRTGDPVEVRWVWKDYRRFTSSEDGLFKGVSLVFPPANPEEELVESEVKSYLRHWLMLELREKIFESEKRDVQIRIKLRNGTITHDLAYSAAGFYKAFERLSCNPYSTFFTVKRREYVF